MSKSQHSWRDLVLLETHPVHHYVWTIYNHKLWLILFWSALLHCCGFGKQSQILLKLVFHINKGFLWTFFSVHTCVVLGDFGYFMYMYRYMQKNTKNINEKIKQLNFVREYIDMSIYMVGWWTSWKPEKMIRVIRSALNLSSVTLKHSM